MQVNSEVMSELILDAGPERAAKAREYNEKRKVNITNVDYYDESNFEVKAKVHGNDIYNTYILVEDGEVEDITCTCPDYERHYGVCKHTLATVFCLRDYDMKTKELNIDVRAVNKNEAKYRNFRQIVNSFYNEEIDDIAEENEDNVKVKGMLRIEPKIFYDRFGGELKVEFKIGNKRLYKIKQLSEFYDRMMNKIFYRYGDKLQFVHTKEAFREEDQPMLDFILKYAEIIKYANANFNNVYHYYGKTLSDTSIMLSNTGIDDLFEILKGKSVKFQKDGLEEMVEFSDSNPNLEFELNKDKKDYVIQPNKDIFKMNIIRGKKYSYILDENIFYRLSPE